LYHSNERRSRIEKEIDSESPIQVRVSEYLGICGTRLGKVGGDVFERTQASLKR
jgi:hypothetical protein